MIQVADSPGKQNPFFALCFYFTGAFHVYKLSNYIPCRGYNGCDMNAAIFMLNEVFICVES